MNEYLVDVAYFGGSHGAFVTYFIDRFSKLTPEIKEEPFMSNGTSHNLNVKYSGRIGRYTFEDVNGNPRNDYKFKNKHTPHILILIDQESLMNFTRLLFVREDDHELTSTSFIETETDTILSDQFVKMYGEKFKMLYNLDIKNKSAPNVLVRDFLKILFLSKENVFLIKSNETRKNINEKTYCLNLSDIWDTDRFLSKMQEASDMLRLELDLGEEAKALHQKFLTKRKTHDSWNRVFKVIESIKNNVNMDCTQLDLVEQGYLCAWIEKNYDFIQTPLTKKFFQDTNEILEYIKNYPNHYKAMNPNLPTFNNIPNPFYLWNKKK